MKPTSIEFAEARQVMTDAPLLARAQAGDLSAFEALIHRHEGAAYSLARWIMQNEPEAEAVTQQAFLSAVVQLPGFREEASFKAWLLRLATQAALKVIRKRKGRDAVSWTEATEVSGGLESFPHPEYIAEWRQSPAQLAERNDTRGLLEEALACLNEKHRLVFLLRDVAGMSVKETADELGLSESNVKWSLLRARLQLREHLTRTLGDPQTCIERRHEQ